MKKILLLLMMFAFCTFGQDTLVCVGNSITAGYNASDSTQRYVNKLAALIGMPYYNSGINSTVVQNTNAAANNFRDTWRTRVVDHHPTVVVILYGVNDFIQEVGNPSYNYTSALFDNDYRETIDSIKAYLPSAKIIVGSLPFAGGGYRRDSAHTVYRNIIRNIAADKGLTFVDIYNSMMNAGAGALVIADSLHPNDSGMTIIANAFYTGYKSAILNNSEWVSGATYKMPLVINSSTLADTFTNFPATIRILSSTISKQHFTSANNFCIYDTVTKSLLPKVSQYIVNDTVFINPSNLSISNTADKSYMVYAGKGINNANTIAACTTSGMIHNWSFNDTVGSTTAINTAGTSNLTLATSNIISRGGKVLNSALFTGDTTKKVDASSQIIGNGNFTLVFDLYVSNFANSPTIFGNGRFYVSFDGSGNIYITNNASTFVAYGTIPLLRWTQIAIARSGNNVSVYKNGVLHSTQNAGAATTGTVNLRIGDNTPAANHPLNGRIDEVKIFNTAKSAAFVSSLYKFSYNVNTYNFGVETYRSSSTTVSRWDSYKAVFKSAYRKAWK